MINSAFITTTKATPISNDAVLRASVAHDGHVVAYWEALLADDGLAVIADTTVEACHMGRVKSEGKASLFEQAGYEESHGATATGSEKTSAGTAEPTADMANSMNDPEMLGLYVATPAAAARGNRERATFGIADLVLSKDSKRSTGTPRLRRPRKSSADKAAAIRARRNKA